MPRPKATTGSASVIERVDQSFPLAAQAKERPARTQLLSRLKHIIGLDRAIGFTVLARGWSVLSGALTVLLIARFLSPAEQGYYYTFASLVSLGLSLNLGFLSSSYSLLRTNALNSAFWRQAR